jgi:hypothetical protein
MAAGLQRHEQGRPAGKFARVTQSHDFGVGVPGALRRPPPHNQTVFHYNGTHRRIRAAYADGPEGKFKCKLQEVH